MVGSPLSTASSAATPGRGHALRQRRNPRACDGCSRHGVRCTLISGNDRQCQRCLDFGEPCTFDRPVGKRRAKPRNVHQAASSYKGIEKHVVEDSSSRITSVRSLCSCKDCHKWSAPVSPSQDVVLRLAEVYRQVVYPVFPLFHQPTLLHRILRCDYLTNRPFYAATMAMCALAAARIRDGAQSLALSSGKISGPPSSEAFFDQARGTIPSNTDASHAFEYMRAATLLAITAIQYGKSELMHYYLGVYRTFVAVGGLPNEDNWPDELSIVERGECRRLYWSTYTLDVFTSIVWDGMIRSREGFYNVAYSSDTDDSLSAKIHDPRSRQLEESTWLVAWNFVTDLYRVLEHAADDLRRLRSTGNNPLPVQVYLASNVLPHGSILYHVLWMYDRLPENFKTTRPPTGDSRTDLDSFQAANIAATIQLVRMVYLARDHSTTEQKLQVASDVIKAFSSVPRVYLRAISIPLLYHLAGIGSILGQSFESHMSESSYQSIRAVLLTLADFLATLEVDLFCRPGTSDKLKAMVIRINESMERQRVDFSMDIAHAEFNTRAVAREGDTQFHFPLELELFEDWSWTLNLVDN